MTCSTGVSPGDGPQAAEGQVVKCPEQTFIVRGMSRSKTLSTAILSTSMVLGEASFFIRLGATLVVDAGYVLGNIGLDKAIDLNVKELRG